MNRFFKFIVLFVALCYTSNVNATFFIDPAACNADNPAWYAWAWADGQEGGWLEGIPDGALIRFENGAKKPCYFGSHEPKQSKPAYMGC